MSVPEAVDARELVGELPAFALLPERGSDARRRELRARLVPVRRRDRPRGRRGRRVLRARGRLRARRQAGRPRRGGAAQRAPPRRQLRRDGAARGDGPARDRAREQRRAGAPAGQVRLHGADPLAPAGPRGVPGARDRPVAVELLPRPLELRAALERGARAARLGARASRRAGRRDRSCARAIRPGRCT